MFYRKRKKKIGGFAEQKGFSPPKIKPSFTIVKYHLCLSQVTDVIVLYITIDSKAFSDTLDFCSSYLKSEIGGKNEKKKTSTGFM